MLDKSKLYKSTGNDVFRKLRILFEDDISWYVEDLTRYDGHSHYIRMSFKKTSFGLEELRGTFLLFVPELRAKGYEIRADSYNRAVVELNYHLAVQKSPTDCKRRADKDFILDSGRNGIFGADK